MKPLHQAVDEYIALRRSLGFNADKFFNSLGFRLWKVSKRRRMLWFAVSKRNSKGTWSFQVM